jgi:hypothetical protein
MLPGDLLTLRHFNFPVNIIRLYDRLLASRLGNRFLLCVWMTGKSFGLLLAYNRPLPQAGTMGVR